MNDYVLDGRYELLERIAAGGMGEVWLGVDRQLDRQVAIKLLHATHASDEQFRARFRAEARYAGSLSHPGITQIYSYGEHSPLGGPYLVMEYVAGEPLSAILERVGRLPAETVLDIISQTARALDVAHQTGIVHRDIKPGNLLIMADGTTKITDFGIAKAREWGDPQLTATGIVMGTAMYVSPEQATGAPVTGSSDIYSLGVVAYECLAGQPPFMAEQPLAIAIMHKHDPVPPLPPDVPWQVSDLVMTMLAKTPDGRPESARHLADRADIIRDARAQTGDYATTASLPVIHDFPESDYPTSRYSTADYPDPDYPAQYDDYPDDLYQGDYPERPVGSVLSRHRYAAAGMGVALCGIGAVVAVLLASGNSPQKPADPPAPHVSASATRHPAKTHPKATHASPSDSSINVDTTPATAPAQQPTHPQPSPTPTPTTPTPTPTRPSAPPTSPTASASSSTPTATPSLPVIFTSSPTDNSQATRQG